MNRLTPSLLLAFFASSFVSPSDAAKANGDANARHATSGQLLQQPVVLEDSGRFCISVKYEKEEAGDAKCAQPTTNHPYVAIIGTESCGFGVDELVCWDVKLKSGGYKDFIPYVVLKKHEAAPTCKEPNKGKCTLDALSKDYEKDSTQFIELLRAYERVNTQLREYGLERVQFSPNASWDGQNVQVTKFAEYLTEYMKGADASHQQAGLLRADLAAALQSLREPQRIDETVALLAEIETFERQLEASLSNAADVAKTVEPLLGYYDPALDGRPLTSHSAIFRGEILVGQNKKAIGFETDGHFIGNVSSESFRLTNTEYLYFFVQLPETENARYLLSSEATVQEAQVIAPQAASEAARLTMTDPPTYNDKRRADYELRRLTNGRRFPARSEVELKLTKVAAPGQEEEIRVAHVRILGSYRWALGSGLAFSFLEERTYVLGEKVEEAKGDVPARFRIEEQSRDTIIPALLVTHYFVPRTYSDLARFEPKNMWPGLLVGFRLDDPRKDWLLGFSVEPLRGFQLMGGLNLGVRSVLSGGQDLTDTTLATGEVPVTKEVFKSGGFIGFSFDLNLFATSLLSL